MSITHVRWVPDGAGSRAVERTEAHVRAHLSSVADPQDDPRRYAGQVRVEHEAGDGGRTIRGVLDRDPDAPYLFADFDLDADAGRYAFVAPVPDGVAPEYADRDPGGEPR